MSTMGQKMISRSEKALRVCAVLCLLLLGSCTAHTQVNVNHVSLNAGIIRMVSPYSSDASGFPFVFYPEIQVGGALFTPGVQWNAFWGYADDASRGGRNYLGGVYCGHSVGIRLEIRPEQLLPRWVIPIGVFAGVGYHTFAYRELTYGIWVESTPSQGPFGRDLSEHLIACEVGANLEFRIVGPFALRAEFRQVIPLRHRWPDTMVLERRSVTAGVGVAL